MIKSTGLSTLGLKVFEVKNQIIRGDGDKANEIDRNFSKSKMLKNDKSEIFRNIGVMEKLTFLTLSTKKTFN